MHSPETGLCSFQHEMLQPEQKPHPPQYGQRPSGFLPAMQSVNCHCSHCSLLSRHSPLGSVGAVVMVVWEAAEVDSPPQLSATLWPAHMAFSVWKTAWGATFIFNSSTMILREREEEEHEKQTNSLFLLCIPPHTHTHTHAPGSFPPGYQCAYLNTSWSIVSPAAWVSSYSSVSSALSTFFFLMAYFCTLEVTTRAGESGAEGRVCCGGWDISGGCLGAEDAWLYTRYRETQV